jgi:hypothetical protein
VNKFSFSAGPPDLSRIPNSEIIGVTVILLSCSYEDREFVRVGYYVNNEYTDEALALEPPAKPVIEKVRRSILAEKPRVTRFAIKWYDSREKRSKRLLIPTGILKSLLPQSSPLTSPMPMRALQTATSTVLRRRKRRRLRLSKVRPSRARMPKWPAARRLLDLPSTTTPFLKPAVRRSISRRLRAKTRRKRARKVVTMIWRWTSLRLPVVTSTRNHLWLKM